MTDTSTDIHTRLEPNKAKARQWFESLRDQICTSLEKIEASIAQHEYSHMELMSLRQEVTEVFLADKKLKASERYLDRLLDNILY